MIKFTGNDGDRRYLGIGLSQENCQRLLTGEPIKFSTGELQLGIDCDIIIIGGTTEQELINMLGLDTDTKFIKHNREHYTDPPDPELN